MKADRDTGIMYEQWNVSACEAVVLLVHGLGSHSGRWKFLAEFLSDFNVSAYSLELRGFGQTQGLRGHVDSFEAYYEDIECLHEIAIRENPGKKIFILGESLGGLIAFVETVLHPGLFDGLVCISPSFDTKLPISLLTYMDFSLALLYNHKKLFKLPLASEMCTRDIDFQKTIDDDPMNSYSVSARFLLNIIFAQRRARKLASQLKLPTLFLIAGSDAVVSPGYCRKIFQLIGAVDKNCIEYPEMAHALSIDLGKEKVFGDIMQWLQQH